MNSELYIIIAIGLIAYIGNKIYLYLRNSKAKKVYKIVEDFIDEYFIEVKKAFDNYQLNLKIHKYDILSETIKIKQSKKYIKSDITEALDILKRRILNDTYEKYFFSNYKIKNNWDYNELIKIFNQSSYLVKLENLNESIVGLSTELAIDEYEKKNIKVYKALEFIALYSYNLRTMYSNYPDLTYMHLKDEIREIKELNYPIESLITYNKL